MTGKSLRNHLIAIVLRSGSATFMSWKVAESYWSSEPYPGGQTAREMLPERSSLRSGIETLVQQWSFPIAAVLFVALYGAAASLMELDGNTKLVMAAIWLYPFYGLWLIMLILPLFAGVAAAIVALAVSLYKRRRKVAWFAAGAIAYNLAAAYLTLLWYRACFVVFGD